MLGLTKASRKFLASYEEEYPDLEHGASVAQNIVKEVLVGYRVKIDSVTSRAKTIDSTRGKLREKDYDDPTVDLTDIIGVRVITYYRDDVDAVVKRLSEEFSLDKARSVDRSVPLGLRAHAKSRVPKFLGFREFGYQSVHLIVKLKSLRARVPEYLALRGKWFEIQVRTLVEHAWAQIEHEVVYKSGINHLPETSRRFAAAAATLELLDSEFLRLREEQNTLIDFYLGRYQAGRDMARRFDVARLVAFLEASRPHGLGWRLAHRNGSPFPKGLDRMCVQALIKVGLFSGNKLERMMRTARFRRSLDYMAVSQSIASAGVPHPTVAAVAAVVTKPDLCKRHFPEMLDDPLLASLLNRLSASERTRRIAHQRRRSHRGRTRARQA